MTYVLSGQAWGTQPITWDFTGLTLPGDGSTPFSNVITQQDARTVVVTAFETWARAANLQFVFAAQDSAAVDVRIGWDTLPSVSGGAHNVELGETDARYVRATGSFVPDIRIRLLAPSSTTLSDATGVPTYSDYDATLYQVALHEIGHAIGLAHDTSNPSAIMYPYAGPQNRVITTDDILGAQAIYGAPQTSFIDIGDNQETVSGSEAGAPSTVFGSSGALDYAGNTGLIVLDTGSAQVEAGIVTVFAGSGSLEAAGNVLGEFILGSGYSSITGGDASSRDVVFGGTGDFTYVGGQEAASVIGGAGSDTITGGAGGGFYSGGSGGNNILTASGIGTVLVGGGGGDTLSAAPTGYCYLVAGSGNETLVGNGGGTDRFFLGAGNDQVNLGAGDNIVVAGNGAGIAVILAAAGSNADLFGGTGGALLYDVFSASTMSITGFRQGIDHINGTYGPSVSIAGGNTVLRFDGGAVVTLNGVVDPSGAGLLT